MKDGPAKSAWHSEHELTLRKQGNSSSSATLTEPAEAAVGAVGGESDSTLGLRVIPGVGGAAKVGATAHPKGSCATVRVHETGEKKTNAGSQSSRAWARP